VPQITFPMRGSTSKKQDINSTRSSVSTADTHANSELQALQERCYHEIIDVCRCIAYSLGVSSASIMNVQVKSLIFTTISLLAFSYVVFAFSFHRLLPLFYKERQGYRMVRSVCHFPMVY
jgi:hypothetical protein